jgi:ATP-dependent helicase/nuclease subunit A
MSLLAAMWPAVSDIFLAAANAERAAIPARVPTTPAETAQTRRAAMRLSLDSPPPSLPTAIVGEREVANGLEAMLSGEIDFEWAGNSARHIGTVVHGVLQTMADEGLDKWSDQRVDRSRAMFERDLSRLGVTEKDLPKSVDRVVRALTKTLADARGRWILQTHAGARSEWRLSGVVENMVAHVAIDRTFTDESGSRWIIDFKTGGHEGADIDAFLDNEQARYRQQLETYAALVASMDAATSESATHASIRLGLYFPLLSGWREWQWQSDADSPQSA